MPAGDKRTRQGHSYCVCRQVWDGVTSLDPWEPGDVAHILTSCITTPAVQDLPQGTVLLLLCAQLSSPCHIIPRDCQGSSLS